ncbi:DUF4270 domain-containing protein [Segatella copri]|uniref:DUF4270 domain-containing protein n=1 Tax=Segatella copri TaxID=165179 RepID=UPI002FF1A50F
MKILRLLTVLVIAALTFAACDDTTEGIGGSITNKIDNINISNSAFNVTTKSIVADSVLSRNNTGLIGKMKDPETGNYVKGDYMTQLSVLPTFSVDTLDYIKQANNGSIEADSCYLLVSYNASYGDTIAPMKVTAYEMTKPMAENKEYYSNYDAFKEGWVSENNQHWSSNYNLSNTSDVKNFKIYLNKKYKKDGKTYKNYGSYIMQTYAEHPEYFKTNFKFLHNVCPGFYIKNVGGTGNMAKIWNTELIFYWTRKKTIKAKDGVKDSTAVSIGYNRFDGTEEVLQLNKIENDTENLEKLASQQNWTYLKSPAGIFTEVTLPIEDIMKGHEKDTLNTATISFPRLNADEDNPYNFATPSTILMVQKDSLQSFFEKSKLADSRTSYTASYSSTGTYKNAYTFQNIANLVSAMYKNKGKGENWNKVVLVPVNVITTTQGYTTVISKINHDMSLASTRLIVGTDDPDKDYTTDEKTGKKVASGPIRIKVIYSKFKEE